MIRDAGVCAGPGVGASNWITERLVNRPQVYRLAGGGQVRDLCYVSRFAADLIFMNTLDCHSTRRRSVMNWFLVLIGDRTWKYSFHALLAGTCEPMRRKLRAL